MCCLVQKERWFGLEWRYNVWPLIRPFFITRPHQAKWGAGRSRSWRPAWRSVRPGGPRHSADARGVGGSPRVIYEGVQNRLGAIVGGGDAVPDAGEEVVEVPRKGLRHLLSPFRRGDRVVLARQNECRHIAGDRGVFLWVRRRGAPYLAHGEDSLAAKRLALRQAGQLRVRPHLRR